MATNHGPETESYALPEGMSDDPMASYNPSHALMGEETSPEETLGSDEHDGLSQQETAQQPGVTGETIDGPAGDPEFAMMRVVGRGGYGVVWEGVQKNLGRVVAIKCMRPELMRSAPANSERMQFLQRSFYEEAFTAAQLDHPNIVPIYDMGSDPKGFPLLAMKLVKGNNWQKEIQNDASMLSEDDFLARHVPILLGVAQAVAFAHSRGVVHRDLKPSQVMIGEFGEVLLMDWGLAISFERGSWDPDTHMPLPGVTPTPTSPTATNPAGTPAFMAPEQTEPTAHNVGPWTDVYLLGGTLYYILTGRLPHDGGGSTTLAFTLAINGRYMDPAEAAPGRRLPDELLALVKESMQPRIADRKLTARQFASRLQDFLSGASKRRESDAITREVVGTLSTKTDDYQILDGAVGALGRARSLWPSNPVVDELRERALGAFVQAALTHGDHVLARVQAKRLATGPEKDRLIAEIDRAAARARSNARTRRHAIAAVMILFVVIVLGTFVFNARLSNEVRQREIARDLAERQGTLARAQEARAIEARADADRLVNFMLTDLKDKLEPMGRLPILDGVVEKAEQYLEGRSDTDQAAADTHLRIAEVLKAQGKRDEAIAAYRKSLAILEKAKTPKAGEIAAVRTKIEEMEKAAGSK